jgi:type II secretory pathway predicted ATPase ExeA
MVDKFFTFKRGADGKLRPIVRKSALPFKACTSATSTIPRCATKHDRAALETCRQAREDGV